jgi:putative ABC transport system ATP-binding protein
MPSDPASAIIRTERITKIYSAGSTEVRALRGIDLTVQRGEMTAVMGASGSGKSTLMNILGCLDTPTGGVYQLDGVRVDSLDRNQLADIRNDRIGFVFQGFNLIARTSALENVELPLLYSRKDGAANSRRRAEEALERVGLTDRMSHEPSELSGGEQQRVAIARALVNRPAILLADEPTGNLDSRTTAEIMSLFRELHGEGITILVVTHEDEVSGYAGRIIELRDGLVIRDTAADGGRPAEPPPDPAGRGGEAG